jgi:ketosteroid isomerase-like protein
MERLETAIRLVLEYKDAFNRHDVRGIMNLMSEDCLIDTTDASPDGIVIPGRENADRYWQDYFHRSPQAHLEIEEVFGLGNRCILRWKSTWIDGAGKNRHVRGVDIFLVRENLIREQRSYVKG